MSLQSDKEKLERNQRIERIAASILGGSASIERTFGGFSSMTMQVTMAIETAQELMRQIDALPYDPK